tara:strand:+ start:3513 stop:4343 length:831 start_codon:yes stop_codon:yes gene_type:complete
MPRNRALSDTGLQLFSQAYQFAGPINKPGCLKSLIHNLFTTDYDKKLDKTALNMKASTSKVLSMLYNIDAIPDIHNKGIANIVALILTNGEKALTVHQVKYNLGFYLNLANKAMKDNDHQTALLIKSAIANHNIHRLKIKLNKSKQKILDTLNQKYGNFNNMHSTHLKEMIDNKEDPYYLPSAMVLHMHMRRNQEYSKAFKSFAHVDTSKLKQQKIHLHEIQNYHYNNHKTTEFELCPIYDTNPLDLKVANQMMSPVKKISINEFLFLLSCNTIRK